MFDISGFFIFGCFVPVVDQFGFYEVLGNDGVLTFVKVNALGDIVRETVHGPVLTLFMMVLVGWVL